MKIFCINCGFEIKFADDELVHVESGSSLCNPIATHDSMMIAEAMDEEGMQEWLESQTDIKEKADGPSTKSVADNAESSSGVRRESEAVDSTGGDADDRTGEAEDTKELEAVAVSREYCD